MISTAADLIAREGAMLVLLGLLGSGPAALLPGGLPRLVRVALAPSLGLALGLGAMLSAAQLMPMSAGAWAVLVPLCLISAAIAAWRGRTVLRERVRPSLPRIAALVVAIAVPAACLDAPFVDQRSVGPAAYYVADAAGYANLAEALADHEWGSRNFGRNFARTGTLGNHGLHEVIDGQLFQSGTAPLTAAIDETFGWRPIDAQAAFMVVLVVIGALGCLALLLFATGSALAAAAGALLYAGPVSYQLLIDGSQPALTALALFAALGLAGTLLGRHPRGAGALLGLLAAGVAVSYPTFLPTVLGSVAIGFAVWLWRTPGARRATARTIGVAIAAAVLTGVVVGGVALAHDASYAKAISSGVLDENYGEAVFDTPVRTLSFGRPIHSPTFNDQLPRWDVSGSSVPAWLTGSRDIYHLPGPDAGGLAHWLALDLLFPLLVLGLAVLGALRFRELRPLLCAAVAAPLVALYAISARDCTYCGQRNLLPLAVVVALLAAAGVAFALESIRARGAGRAVVAALALGVAILLLVPLQRDSVLARRLTEGGAFLGSAERPVLDRAAQVRGLVAIEAPGAGPTHAAGAETALLQAAAVQVLPRPAQFDPAGLPAVSYRPGQRPRESELDPAYRWVMTRLAGVRTPRTVVLERGPYALELRRRPLDATITSGVIADLSQDDPRGAPWIQGRVEFTVAAAGAARGAPASLLVGLAGPAAAGASPLGAARRLGAKQACVPVPGQGAIRRASLRLRFHQPPPPAPGGYGQVAGPPHGVRIASLQPVQGSCGRAARP